MLISHEYQFIFIKTRKTAGTSIEISLSRYLGPFDVITPITPTDELLRAQLGITPQNYMQAVHALPEPGQQNDASIQKMLTTANLQRRFYNHCPASEIRAAVGERIWRTYTKFCFERDPWERVISEFYFVQRTKPEQFGGMSLEQFVEQDLYSLNYPLYEIEGQTAVDQFCRYETLAADLTGICARLGIPFDGWLPRAKSFSRPDQKRQPASELLTAKLVDRIAQRCQREINRFNYREPFAA